MRIIRILFCLSLLLCSIRSVAQLTVEGKLFDKDNKDILYAATVRNTRTGEVNLSDLGGNYKIHAAKGDKIVFTYIGYFPDSLTVSAVSGTVLRDIYLEVKRNKLGEVEVNAGLTPYQVDSLSRMKEFGHFLSQPRYNIFGQVPGSATGGYMPTGFGFSFSPISHFSRDQRRRRKFAKLYAEEEKQAYIDSRYTTELVTHVTGLQGDSLLTFMRSHQPPYKFLRTASDQGLVYWISHTCKLYREGIKRVPAGS